MNIVFRNITDNVLGTLENYSVIGIIGSRQVGKSTLVKELQKKIPKSSIYLDLQLPSDRNKLINPEDFLSSIKKELVILDEIQIMEELFPIIRALVDKKEHNVQYILLGSASPDLMRRSSESLAGRIAYHELTPFHLLEIIQEKNYSFHRLRGGYPKAFLASNDRIAFSWLQNYISTFIERDLANLGLNYSRTIVEKTLNLLVSSHGQMLNSNAFSRALGITNPTVKRYMDILESAFIVRFLKPYHINIRKRLVKSPKVYIRDVGILHDLANIRSQESLLNNLLVGFSWEGYVIEQIIAATYAKLNYYYYRTHNDAEVDLVIEDYENRIWCIEIKNTNAPTLTRGYYESVLDIKPQYQYIITPDSITYFFNKEITVTSLKDFLVNEVPEMGAA